jgi:hypothetical protein
MAFKSKTIDKDLGYKRILEEYTTIKSNKPHVKVGLQTTMDQRKKKRREGGESNESVLDVGVRHEFGLGVPERSYMRLTYDKTKEEMFRFIKTQNSKILLGKTTVRKALDLVGQKSQTDIKDTIKRTPSEWPPLAESTILKKGSSKPLIDTGQLINSIQYKKVMK